MNKPTKLQPAEYVSRTYHHIPATGAALDDVLDPAYWAHVAKSLRPGDHIEILAEDGTWWAMLLVRYTGRTEAAVAKLSHVEFGEPSDDLVSDSDTHSIAYGNYHTKFRVVRKSDKEVVKDGFDTKEAAKRWLDGHMKALAA